MGAHDRRYRTDFRSYGSERSLEIVTTDAYKPGPRPWMVAEQLPPPPPPEKKKSKDASGSSGWVFSDPEVKRRRRVASYKAYTVEGKVKASLRQGLLWIKAKCSELVHGW